MYLSHSSFKTTNYWGCRPKLCIYQSGALTEDSKYKHWHTKKSWSSDSILSKMHDVSFLPPAWFSLVVHANFTWPTTTLIFFLIFSPPNSSFCSFSSNCQFIVKTIWMEIGRTSVQISIEEMRSLTLKCWVWMASSWPAYGAVLSIAGNAGCN